LASLSNLRPAAPLEVLTASGHTLHTSQAGVMKLPVTASLEGGRTTELTLENVYYGPSLPLTLISASQLDAAGHSITIRNGACTVRERETNRVLLVAPESDGVYVVAGGNSGQLTRCCLSLAGGDSLTNWHKRLGHISFKTIQRMARIGATNGLLLTDTTGETCEACLRGKMTRTPIRKASSTAGMAADAICHADLGGPFRKSLHGKRYLMRISWQGFLWCHFLRHKSEAAAKMEEFLQYIARQHNVNTAKLKIVRTDNGGEFTGQDFRSLCLKRGLRLQTTHAYSSFENGIAERANRTVCDMAATMFIESSLPHSLWEYAVCHAVFVQNRVLHKRSSTATPLERITGEKPTLHGLRAFGEAVMIHIPAKERSKRLRFVPRAVVAAYIGYEEERKGVYAYSRSPTARVWTSRDYKFLNRSYKPSPDDLALDDKTPGDDLPETDDDKTARARSDDGDSDPTRK